MPRVSGTVKTRGTAKLASTPSTVTVVGNPHASMVRLPKARPAIAPVTDTAFNKAAADARSSVGNSSLLIAVNAGTNRLEPKLPTTIQMISQAPGCQ